MTSFKEHKVKVLYEDPRNKLKWDWPLLPNAVKCFRLLCVSPSNTGKSTVIAYMFGSDDLPYKKYFKTNVFIFSPTAKLGSMNLPHVKSENIHDSFDVEFLKRLWEEQDALIAKHGRAKSVPILLIFDDVVSDLNSVKKEYLKKLWMHGRHSNFSCVLCSQQYRSVPKPVRMNSSHMIILLLSSAAESKALSEEQPYNEKKFLAIVDESLNDEPYSFLLINYAAPKERQLQLRFSNIFFSLKDKED